MWGPLHHYQEPRQEKPPRNQDALCLRTHGHWLLLRGTFCCLCRWQRGQEGRKETGIQKERCMLEFLNSLVRGFFFSFLCFRWKLTLIKRLSCIAYTEFQKRLENIRGRVKISLKWIVNAPEAGLNFSKWCGGSAFARSGLRPCWRWPKKSSRRLAWTSLGTEGNSSNVYNSFFFQWRSFPFISLFFPPTTRWVVTWSSIPLALFNSIMLTEPHLIKGTSVDAHSRIRSGAGAEIDWGQLFHTYFNLRVLRPRQTVRRI